MNYQNGNGNIQITIQGQGNGQTWDVSATGVIKFGNKPK